MSRIRVMELAKELGLDNKVAIAKLAEIGIHVKNHFNALEGAEADRLRAVMSPSKAAKAADKAPAATSNRMIIRRRNEDSEPSPADSSAESAQAGKPKILIRRRTDETPTDSGLPQTISADAEPRTREELGSAVAASANETVSTAQPEPAPRGPAAPVTPFEDTPQPVEVREASTAAAAGSTSFDRANDEASAPLAASRSAQGASTPSVAPPTTASSMNTPQPSATSAQRTQPTGSGISATVIRRPEREQGAVIVRRSPPTGATQPPAGYSPGGRRFGGPDDGPRGGRFNDQDDRGPREARGPYVARPERTGGGDYRSGGPGGPGGPGRPPMGRSGPGASGPGGYRQDGRPFTGGPRSDGPGGPGSRFGGGRPGGDDFGRRGGEGGFRGGPSLPPLADSSARGEVPSRDRVRDREKDKEKRKIQDEETQRRIRLKQAQDEGVFIDPDDEEADVAGVRNFIPQRRRGSARRKDSVRAKDAINPMKASKRVVRIDDSLSVNSLAQQMSVKASAVIKSLMSLGVLANVNQQLDTDTATLVAQEFGFEVQNVARSLGDILSTESHSTEQEEQFEQYTRAPVVTIMGHVDHGKTSLLDAIRQSNKTASEAGGITQHIGAYRVTRDGRAITFIDTPGHAAFTEMRARGAKVTDLVILVVAADDGVMPQTVEAISHARSAGVPIVVAVNKIDKPSANYDRILADLAGQGVTAEEWGGDSMFVKVSALTKQGIGELLDAVLLQAEVLDLKARTEGQAEGIVIESRLDKARGPVATFLVNKGTLRKGDSIVAGRCAGRVRALFDDLGEKLDEVLPGVPVEVLGLDSVPSAGDSFNVVANDSVAKQAVQYRVDKDRKERAAAAAKTTIQDLLAQLGTDKNGLKELPLIVKADTHGSVEAIRHSLQKLGTEQVICKVVHAAVGGITETDVTLASAAHALVIGFNVRPDRKASESAESLGVDIKTFAIIYELIDTVEQAMAGRLEPIRQERVQGHAEVRNLFSVPKIGVIAGCGVTDGKMSRNAHIRVIRDGIVLFTGRVGSLKRFKEDAREVASGYECGIGVENYNDLRVGDTLECFVVEEIAATLRPPTGASASSSAAQGGG